MQANFLTWFEIPAFDFDKAVNFYSLIFGIKIECREMGSIPYGIMNASQMGSSGAIVKVYEKTVANQGTVLFFRVNDMSETIRRIKLLGGTILREKTIIRNEMADGRTVIPKTLIDETVGYYASYLDLEGNKMALYSNS